jgi:hypothetical protein
MPPLFFDLKCFLSMSAFVMPRSIYVISLQMRVWGSARPSRGRCRRGQVLIRKDNRCLWTGARTKHNPAISTITGLAPGRRKQHSCLPMRMFRRVFRISSPAACAALTYVSVNVSSWEHPNDRQKADGTGWAIAPPKPLFYEREWISVLVFWLVFVVSSFGHRMTWWDIQYHLIISS